MSTCDRCRFFQPDNPDLDPATGSCRRNPPLPYWPIVNRNDWCGEWKPTAVAEMTRRKAAKASGRAA